MRGTPLNTLTAGWLTLGAATIGAFGVIWAKIIENRAAAKKLLVDAEGVALRKLELEAKKAADYNNLADELRSDLQEERVELKGKVADLSGQVDRLNTKLDQVLAELTTYKDRAEKAESECEKAKTETERVTRKAERVAKDFAAQITSLQDENDKLKISLNITSSTVLVHEAVSHERAKIEKERDSQL